MGVCVWRDRLWDRRRNHDGCSGRRRPRRSGQVRIGQIDPGWAEEKIHFCTHRSVFRAVAVNDGLPCKHNHLVRRELFKCCRWRRDAASCTARITKSHYSAWLRPSPQRSSPTFPFTEVGRRFLPFLIWSAFLPWEHLTRFKAGAAIQLFRLRCESRNLQRHQQSTALCSGLHENDPASNDLCLLDDRRSSHVRSATRIRQHPWQLICDLGPTPCLASRL